MALTLAPPPPRWPWSHPCAPAAPCEPRDPLARAGRRGALQELPFPPGQFPSGIFWWVQAFYQGWGGRQEGEDGDPTPAPSCEHPQPGCAARTHPRAGELPASSCCGRWRSSAETPGSHSPDLPLSPQQLIGTAERSPNAPASTRNTCFYSVWAITRLLMNCICTLNRRAGELAGEQRPGWVPPDREPGKTARKGVSLGGNGDMKSSAGLGMRKGRLSQVKHFVLERELLL